MAINHFNRNFSEHSSASENENIKQIRIINPTQKPVTIYRCTTVGTITPSAASMSVIATSDTPAQSPPPVGDEETAPLDFTSTNLDEHQLSELKSLTA